MPLTRDTLNVCRQHVILRFAIVFVFRAYAEPMKMTAKMLSMNEPHATAREGITGYLRPRCLSSDADAYLQNAGAQGGYAAASPKGRSFNLFRKFTSFSRRIFSLLVRAALKRVFAETAAYSRQLPSPAFR